MNRHPSQSLLAADEPPPVRIINPAGTSTFLLLGDHAGNAIPAALGSLGVGEADLARHIAWDIGVGGLGAVLAAALDAVFIRQTYSRLVVDCNRDPDAGDAMPEISDGTAIPGNRGLTPAERAARLVAIHEPYQTAIAAECVRRRAAGIGTVLVSLHSFTPSMKGKDRPWQIGVLHGGGNVSFALNLLGVLEGRGAWTVGDNQPYAMDGTDHSIPRHAYPDALPYAELEIRQDLLATPDQQRHWSDILATALPDALNLSSGA
jgi:predicted N-formylglutamate amidohydrolase